jgi:hypothetical protein
MIKFVSQYLAIIIGCGVMTLFLIPALVGSRPPPPAREMMTLTPEEHRSLVADIVSAITAGTDAGDAQSHR